MDYQIDSNGKKIPVSYFGNLEEKRNFAQSYIQMFNSMAADNHSPQVDIQVALKNIQKAYDKCYGNQSKYDGKGVLKNA